MSESIDIRRRGPQMSVLARAAILTGCWLPFVAAAMFYVPRFVPIFDKLRQIGELPPLTDWLLSFGQLNEAFFGLPLLFLAPLLITADEGAARLAKATYWAASLYWYWFVTLAVCGFLAFFSRSTHCCRRCSRCANPGVTYVGCGPQAAVHHQGAQSAHIG
jgi:type II secretory pathway component PulF